MGLRAGDRRVVIDGRVVDGIRAFINDRREALGAKPIKTDSGVLAVVLEAYQAHVMNPYFERERKLLQAERAYNDWAEQRAFWQKRLREGKVITDAEVLEYQRVISQPPPKVDV